MKALFKQKFSRFIHVWGQILALQLNTNPDPGCQINTDPHGSTGYRYNTTGSSSCRSFEIEIRISLAKPDPWQVCISVEILANTERHKICFMDPNLLISDQNLDPCHCIVHNGYGTFLVLRDYFTHMK